MNDEKDEEAGIEMTEEPQQNEMPTLQMTQMPTSLLYERRCNIQRFIQPPMVDKKDSSITGSKLPIAGILAMKRWCILSIWAPWMKFL